MSLTDNVILVTGSTAGIGEAIARHLVQQGAKVMLHGRNETQAKKLHDELGAENSAYIVADLADITILPSLIDETVAKFGRIDSLVNNAGIYPRTTIDDVTPEIYQQVMDINFRAPLFLMQRAVAQFRKQGDGGTIVNIGSINAHCGEAGMTVYAPSKGALMTVTRNVANEVATENIRINCLNVGWTLTDTESALKQKQGFSPDWEQYIPDTFAPLGHLLRPEHVAAHVAFWASNASYPANGQVYDLEQYPVIGRNLIYTIPLDVFPKKDA